MINKSSILKFIQKYNLDANASGRPDNAIKMVSDGTKLTTSFITEDKSLLGFVQVLNVEFPIGEFGVYETTKLENMIKILQNEFNITVQEVGGRKANILLKDDQFNVTFVLSDLDVIKAPPELKDIPTGEVTIEVNSIFTDNYIKAKKAIAESDVIAFTNNNGSIELVVNYSKTNTNNIKIPIDVEAPAGFETLLFDGNQFLDVLNSNKDAETGKVSLSSQGLLIATFSGEDFRSKYYLVAGQQ